MEKRTKFTTEAMQNGDYLMRNNSRPFSAVVGVEYFMEGYTKEGKRKSELDGYYFGKELRQVVSK